MSNSETDICGYEETATGKPCQRTSGWGREEDTGYCKDHHPDSDGDAHRPTKLSYERQEQIASAIEKGRSIKSAARMADVSAVCVYNWIDRGKAEKEAGKDNEFVDFFNRITRAKGHGEEFYFSTIVEMAKENGDHRFLASLMKQRYPESWAEKEDAPGVDTNQTVINIPESVTKEWQKQS